MEPYLQSYHSLLTEAQIQFHLWLSLKFSYPRYIEQAIDYVVK